MPQDVKIKKKELLAKLIENRDKHKSQFLAAQEGYRKVIIAELDKRLRQARKGGAIDVRFSFPEPEDHTEDYNREIEMLNMSVDDTITLENHEFDRFVMDRWQWSGMFAATNSRYSS